MKYVIQYKPAENPLVRRFVRVYQSGKYFVPRMHADTATHFVTVAQAQEVIQKFNLSDTQLISV